MNLNTNLSCQSPVRKTREVNILNTTKLVFKAGVFKMILRMKGMTQRELAKVIGCTEQYISYVAHGGKVSDRFLLQLLSITGNENNLKVVAEWFRVVPIMNNYNPNHQMWNMPKYNGEFSYAKITDTCYSPDGEFRKQDYDID